MNVPMYRPHFDDHEARLVAAAMSSGEIASFGAYLEQFEAGFAQLCECRYAQAVANGTVSIHAALHALGVGPGDEVIVPALTFIATVNPVVINGSVPVFVDVDPETFTIDPKQIEAKVTQRTRAIVVVHLYGHPADMEPIMALADHYDLKVIEDAAEAHGARYKGKPVGSIGHAGSFSMWHNKIITTGEGGVVTTNNADVAERVKGFKSHYYAMDPNDPGKRYYHSAVGQNYRMSNLAAAVGVAQLEKLDQILADRRRMAAFYDEALADIPGVQLPTAKPWATPIWWLYHFLLPLGEDRNGLMNFLEENGVASRPGFVPLHHQPPYYCRDLHFPVSEEAYERGVCLPSGYGLSDAELGQVASLVRSYLKA